MEGVKECDSGFQLLSGGRGGTLSSKKIDRHTPRLTRRHGVEVEPSFAILIEDAVTEVLVDRVHVGEPTDTSTRVSLKPRANEIQKVEVGLYLLQAGDSVWGGGSNRAWCHLGPTVLGKDDLLPLHPGDDPLQIVLDKRPGLFSGGGRGVVIGQHGEIDKVDGIQNRLSAVISLVAVGRFRDGDGNLKRGKVLLGRLDLGDEVFRGQGVIGQGLGTELNGPGDELGLGVAMESREQGIPAGLPIIVTRGIELACG